MERILVGIDASHPAWEPLVRALCLGQRIEARVRVLAVFAPEGGQGRVTAGSDEGRAIIRNVEAQIESAKASGANVELFVAEGRFDQELIEAVGQLKTTLLVAAAAGGDEQGGGREAGTLGRILSGVDCRVELVTPRKHQERTKDGK